MPLVELTGLLQVPPSELASVPLEAIATVHAVDPYAGRRVASPCRRAIDQGFVSATPGVTRPIPAGSYGSAFGRSRS